MKYLFKYKILQLLLNGFLYIFFLSSVHGSPWNGVDVGTTGITGTDSYDAATGTYSVSGGGGDIVGTPDACRYVYQNLTGDGFLEARVTSLENTSVEAKAGLMIRQETAEGSIASMIAVTPAGSRVFLNRIVNGSTTTSSSLGISSLPYWIRIVKDGTLITVYHSPDGINWTYAGLTRLAALTGPVDIGFAVTSGVSGTLCSATFDNITLSSQTSYAPTSPWQNQDIGITGEAGVVHLEENVYSVYGAGTGLTGTADSFHYAYQTLSGNGVIISRINGLSTSTTSAGVVMRQDLTAGAAEVAVLLNATSGISMITRSSAGATAVTTAGAAVSVPSWVKLVRTGNFFSGYQSMDGNTWTLVGSRSVPMTNTLSVGIASASGSTGTLSLGLMDQVTVIPTGNIASGGSHNLYVHSNGTVWSWGLNTNGQLGDGTTTTRTSPVQLATLSGMQAVSGGASHSLGLKSNGTVWSWGLNANGQLGDGTTIQRLSPVPVANLSGMVGISAGSTHSLAVKNDGTVWVWGSNVQGQLGTGNTVAQKVPIQLSTLSGMVAVSAGLYHSIGLKGDGTVWAWGYSGNGQLGDGTTTQRLSPVQVTNLSGVVAISAGPRNNLALKSDGTVWAWGLNANGQLGDGTTLGRTRPVQVMTLSGMTAVQAGSLFSLAIKNDGTVWSWGDNVSGQLGNNSTTPRNSPVQVSGLTEAVQVSAGSLHAMAITSSRAIWGWGDNSKGQLGNGTTISSGVPISLQPVITSALTATGTMGATFHYQITANKMPTHFNATGLPSGLTINTNTGAISGIPTASGSFPVTLSATSVGGTGSATLVLTISGGNVPVISSATTANGIVGSVFSYSITASDHPTSYNATGVPSGLSIDPLSGIISGTPTTAGTSTVSLSATNATGTGTSTLTLIIHPPVPFITSAAIANGTIGTSFNYQITASDLPLNFYATGLPDGLSIDTSSGIISGTPTTAGTFTVTLSASNVTGTGTATLMLTINPPAPTISSANSATAIVGSAFSYAITASHNPTSFNATGLPDGLSIDTSSGIISGTPTTAGIFTVTLSAGNVSGTGTATLVLTISGGNVPVITSASTASGTVGSILSYQITASDNPTSFNATGLPDGLSIDTSSGLISGTPTTAGIFTVILAATNATGTGNKTFTLTVASCVPTGGLPVWGTISSGGNHNLYVQSNGTVWSWGLNTNGQLGDGTTTTRTSPVQLLTLSNMQAVSGGASHSLGLKNDGTVWAWGLNNNSQLGDNTTLQRLNPIPVTTLSGIVAISAGTTHSLAVKNDGTVWVWGSNAQGQLGTGNTATQKVPLQIPTLSGMVGVSAGLYHSIGLKNDGTVWSWGYNANGQLGNGTTTQRLTPGQVTNLSGIVAISAGPRNNLALKDDGTVWSWGLNANGQLGDGSTLQRSIPVQVTTLSGMTAVQAGSLFSLAIKNDGTVWAWGSNTSGQLGNNSTTQRTSPVQVSNLTGAKQVSTGNLHAMAITSSGAIWRWGDNTSGQLGNGTTVASGVPTGGLPVWGAISSGGSHNLYLQSNGTAWSWGLNTNGQLGDGTTTNRLSPVQISTLSGMQAVSGGASHSLGLKSDGTVWSWGDNANAQLGDGTTISRMSPAQVTTLSGMIAISAGTTHSLGLKSDGTVWVWGNNSFGQLGTGTTGTQITPFPLTTLSGMVAVSAGLYHSIGLKNDGTVWSWGDNGNGQLGDGTITPQLSPIQLTGISGVVAISAGPRYNLALKSDGTVWSWGDNENGQLGDGTTTQQRSPVQVTTLSGMTSVQAGGLFSQAIKSDGTVWSWGNNTSGELGNNSTTSSNSPVQTSNLTGARQVSAGTLHAMAITSSGAIWSWGDNTYGQLGNGTTDVSGVPISLQPVITSALTASGTVGTALSYTIAASNSPTSYGMIGTLPAGLIFSGATISGTPTAAGTASVTLKATNVAGSGTATFTLTIATSGQSSLTPTVKRPMPKFAAALQNVMNTPGANAFYVTVGDSTSFGKGAGTDTNHHGSDGAREKTTTAIFAQKIAQLLPSSIEVSQDVWFGFGGVTGPISTLSIPDLYHLYFSRVTFGAGWTSDGPAGLGGTAAQKNSATPGPITFQTLHSCDIVDLYVPIGNDWTGTLAVTFDSDPTVYTISPVAGAKDLRVYSVPLPPALDPNVPHLIKIDSTDSSKVALSGLIARSTTKGRLIVINAGVRSYLATNAQSSTFGFSPLRMLEKIGPHAVDIALGINDFKNHASTTTTQFITDINTVAAKASLTGDVILRSPNDISPSDQTAPSNASMIDVALLLNMIAQGKYSYIDTILDLGDHATVKNAQMYDGLHPNAIYYSRLGTVLVDVVSMGIGLTP